MRAQPSNTHRQRQQNAIQSLIFFIERRNINRFFPYYQEYKEQPKRYCIIFSPFLKVDNNATEMETILMSYLFFRANFKHMDKRFVILRNEEEAQFAPLSFHIKRVLRPCRRNRRACWYRHLMMGKELIHVDQVYSSYAKRWQFFPRGGIAL